MKRIIIFFVLLIPPALAAQSGVYAISFNDADNGAVHLSSFAGKKIIIVTVNATAPDSQQLRSLDTLYRSRADSLIIIAIPVSDCGNENDVPLTDQALKAIFTNELQPGYILARQGKGKKNAGPAQHPLLHWLTHVSSNTHFDRDVEETGQMFVLNESGSLYAVLKKKITATGEQMRLVVSRQF